MNKIAANVFSAVCILLLLSIFSLGVSAQTYDVAVNRGTVVYAQGNSLIIKMEDGTLNLITVPSDYRLTVDGNQVAVSDLKPGTMLTQTITTTNQVQMVTDVRTVDAKIIEVKPDANPPTLTVSTGNKIKYYQVPVGTKFTVNDKDMTLADLKEGMEVKGTVVTAVPTVVPVTTKKVTGKAPPQKVAVATPPQVGILLIETNR